MIPAGMLYQDLSDILSAQNDEELQDRIWNRMNYEYFNICRESSWEALRAPPVTLDFSDADSDGLWIPSDVFGIDMVWDDTNEVEFHPMDRPDSEIDQWGYGYYTYRPSRAHYFQGTDLVLEKGGSSFTSALLTADASVVDGEFVQFDDEPGYYEISSDTTPFTFTPVYYGPDKASKNFRIRPWETSKRMCISDEDEDKLYDRSVDVYYWRAPVALYRMEDMIMLPSTDILKTRVLRGIPEAKDRFPVSQTMIDSSAKRALAQNRKFRRISSPSDKHFQRFDLSNNLFGER